jgi:hypothetical protein
MRARLQRYLPIFLFALLVQVLAPIGASWAVAFAASDPLSAAEICHTTGSIVNQPIDQGGQQTGHRGGCSICCLASAASTSTDTPAAVILAIPYRVLSRVVWQDQTPDLSAFRVGSNAQARAPLAAAPARACGAADLGPFLGRDMRTVQSRTA